MVDPNQDRMFMVERNPAEGAAPKVMLYRASEEQASVADSYYLFTEIEMINHLAGGNEGSREEPVP